MATKTNRKGRSERGDHFTAIPRRTIDTPAWRALSCTAQALYIFFRFEWKGTKYNNNGEIRFSTRQAAEALGISINTAAKAFHVLQAKGYIAVTQRGALGIEGEARGPSYELTEIPMPGQTVGRRLFLEWRDGRDFEVIRHNANNPTGKNGKTCLKI